ncbi:MAG: hypothetical protein IJY31_01195 [Muribaculaceae bacterium]|nr:hypothetical protein [Muribaculaceae bacterium]
MGKILTYILTVTILTATISSCNTTGCTENQNSLPLAGFYSMEDGNSIAIDSISIGGVNAPDDSLLVNNGNDVSRVYLPFRSNSQSSSFFIHYNQKELSAPELNDTVTFDYTSFPVFVSEECGAMYHYTITRLAYTHHLVDSIAITDSVVTNIEKERIKIFFRTVSSDETDGESNSPEGDNNDTEDNSEGNNQQGETETTE